MRSRSLDFPMACAILCAAVLISFGAHAASCPPQGDAAAGTIQAHMNPLKNRIAAPARPRAVSVADILALPKHEDPAQEKRGVTLTGKLIDYKHEGPESPNCHSATRRDYHIWIGTTKPRAVVVELTPPWQDRNPKLAASLSSLKGKTVCVTGWLFFDHEHASQVGKTRGTQWEVHPITAIAGC